MGSSLNLLLEAIAWFGVPTILGFFIAYWLCLKAGKFFSCHSHGVLWPTIGTIFLFLILEPIMVIFGMTFSTGILQGQYGSDGAEVLGILGMGPALLLGFLLWVIGIGGLVFRLRSLKQLI